MESVHFNIMKSIHSVVQLPPVSSSKHPNYPERSRVGEPPHDGFSLAPDHH